MKILFSGSFKFFEEMRKIAEELNSADFEYIFPRFFLGDFSSRKIEEIKKDRKKDGLKDGELEKIAEVEEWFYNRLKESETMIVFDKNGYVGLQVAAEIEAAYVLERPVFFLKSPEDLGIKAMLKFSKNFKIVSLEN